MRVAGEPGTARLPAEAVEVLLAEPALEERPGIDPGGGVALEEDLVARPAVVLAPEEVVEARLVHRSRRGVGRQVAAQPVRAGVGPDHHDRRVPPDERPDAPLHLDVRGRSRLQRGGDGVDVGRGHGLGEPERTLPRDLELGRQQEAGSGRPPKIDDLLE